MLDMEVFKTMNREQQKLVLDLQAKHIEHTASALRLAKAHNSLMGIVLNFLEALATTLIPPIFWPKCVIHFRESVFAWNRQYYKETGVHENEYGIQVGNC